MPPPTLLSEPESDPKIQAMEASLLQMKKAWPKEKEQVEVGGWLPVDPDST